MAEPRIEPSLTLRQVAFFEALDEQQFAFLRSRIHERTFDAGELVFSEGETCAGLFVIHKGNVRIFKNSASGREQVLSIEGPGGTIAELPVFDGGPYPASAQAITQATLLFYSKQDFQALCMKYPEVALRVLEQVGRRLRKLVGIIEELSFTTVRNRLASLLLRLAKTEGKKSAEGVEFALPATNQELAAQIGTVRELVSRNLSRFQSEGLLRIDGRTIIIPDVKKLAAELADGE
jgi:CRP/FNR family transcriptional regulator